MEPSLTTTIIPIKGMTCMGCTNSVKTVLEKLPGVNNVVVSLEEAQATIAHQAGAPTHEDFKRAIEDAGFEIT